MENDKIYISPSGEMVAKYINGKWETFIRSDIILEIYDGHTHNQTPLFQSFIEAERYYETHRNINGKKPFGYVFAGEFFKELAELSGTTFNEDNMPIAAYKL